MSEFCKFRLGHFQRVISRSCCFNQQLFTSLYTRMTSLADELMNDLDDLGSGSEDESFATGTHSESAITTQSTPTPLTTSIKEEEDLSDGGDDIELTDEMYKVPEGGIKPAEELDQDQVNRMDLASISQVNKVAKLYGGKTLKDVLQVWLFRLNWEWEGRIADSEVREVENRSLQVTSRSKPCK